MDTNAQKSVEERLTEMYEQSVEREYKGRVMDVRVESTTDDMKMYKITGKLTLSVSENNDETWQAKDFEVMTYENDPDMGVAQVFAYLNSIPMEYGDMIFEEGFDELISGLLESADGKAEMPQEKTPVQ